MKILFAILIFLLIGVSCQTKQINQLTKQELEVYKSILGEKPKEIVVIDESRVGVFGEISTGGLKKILTGLQSDTFENFVKMNATQTEINDKVRSSFDYPLIIRKDFEEKNIGHYVFSRVGFSKDGKQAVVMFMDIRNPLGMKGAYFLLENKNGIWEITQESESWKS
ncbi:MAG TPA: hypothetical protein VK400_10140 [Pyrinomonadaceae bacterium]|nr:hypothetical protein [Pyrinomonadaceae bacterium]